MKKLFIFGCVIQMMAGLIGAILSILFLKGIINDIFICFVGVFMGMFLSLINMLFLLLWNFKKGK